MRRRTGFLLAALLAFTIPAAQAKTAPKSILMVLWRIETDYDTAFKDRLAQLGVDAQYRTIFGKESRDYLSEVMRDMDGDFAKGRFDLVYTWGSTVSSIVDHVNRGRTPQVFNVVYDPQEIGLVGEPGQPQRAVTGITNGVPVEDQFDAFAKIVALPKLCMVFNPRERNANLALERVIAWTEAHHVPFEDFRVAPGTDTLDKLLGQIEAGEKQCPVIYAAADSYLGSQAKMMSERLAGKAVLLGGTERFVLNGWTLAYAPTVQSMGYAAAELAAKVLRGQSAADLGVVLPHPKLIVSKSAASGQGLTLPAGSEFRD